jgi:hypothetical protein
VGGEAQTAQPGEYAFGYQLGVQSYLRLHTVERCAAFLFRRAVAAMGGDMTRGRLLGSMLKQVGFERIFATPSYERAQSREEWQSFCDAFAGALDHTTISEIGIREGWADQSRFDEVVAALRRFGADTSNCFALAWGEAVGYKAG